MIELQIGGCAVGQYITDGGYNFSSSIVKDSKNAFTDINGTDHTPILGRRIKLDVRLIDVPMVTAKALEGTIRADIIKLQYSAPSSGADDFRCTSFTCDCSDADPDSSGDGNSLWDISASFESAELVTAENGEGL